MPCTVTNILLSMISRTPLHIVGVDNAKNFLKEFNVNIQTEEDIRLNEKARRLFDAIK